VNETDLLRRLGNAAAGEPVPQVDVTAGVLRGIRERYSDLIRPLAIFAAASSVAAAVVAAVAVSAWLEWQDPLAAMFSTLDLVMR